MAETQKPFNILIDKFYGGIVRDDKSKIDGAALNMEEIDIFTNKNFFQAEQVISTEVAGTGIPTGSTLYARTIGNDDTAYAYGKENTGGKVRLFSVASGGGSNPGNFTTLFTSADATNLATPLSDLKFFKSTEASNNTYLLYVRGTGTTWYAVKYNIGTATETSLGQLTGLNGTNMRPTIKIIFDKAYFLQGNTIASLAKDMTWTLAAFTLPAEWEAVDIEPVGDAAIIWCRNISVNTNVSRGFWWDLTLTATFEDQFTIPMGGPQWIKNIKESIVMFCAINGVGKFYKLSFPAKGAIPIELPGIQLTSISTETSTQPISSPKMVTSKDKFIYFGLWKTDKTGIYCLGQLDADKPMAVFLSKRFGTTDYSLHKPYSVIVHGPNYFADFNDNGTDKSVRCATLNTPNRSTQAVYQSVWLDANEPFKNKQLQNVLVATYPLPASTTVATTIAVDYSSSFTAVNKNNGTDMTGTNDRLGNLSGNIQTNSLVYSVKVALTSSTSNSPKVVAIGLNGVLKETATQ